MFAISIYSWIVLAHVTAAMLLIGSSIVGLHTKRAMLAATSAPALRTLLDVFRRAVQAGPPLAITVLATGVYLGSYGWWAQPWFYVAIGLWMLQAMLAARVVRANATSLAAALQSADVKVPPEADAIRRSSAWLVAGAAMRGNDLAFLYLMFNKPSLGESLVVLLLAEILSVLIEAALERRQRTAGVAIHSAAA